MTRVALDTNLIVAAFEPSSQAYEAATELLSRSVNRGVEFVTPPFCLGEFWRVATETNGYGRSVESVIDFLREWFRIAPMAALRSRFRTAVVAELERLKPIGAAAFDVFIGVSARDAGADELWTFDRRFPGIEHLAVVRRPLIERL